MKVLTLLLAVTFFSSCSKEDKKISAEQTEGKQDKTTETPSTSNEVKKTASADSINKMFGYYTGPFVAVEYDDSSPLTYENKITVSLDSVEGNTLFGHSVVAGNVRPFKGNYVYKNNEYSAEVSEPGDDKYDGTFSFIVSPASKNVKGTWTSFKKDTYVTKREYDLKRKDFVYDKNNDIPSDKDWSILYEQNPKFPDRIEQLSSEISKINASNTALKKNDLDNLYKGDLEILRNSIYARHGYTFKNRKMRYFFDSYINWYMPVSDDVRTDLTQVEKDNIELIKRYEEHAEKYYDEYGR